MGETLLRRDPITGRMVEVVKPLTGEKRMTPRQKEDRAKAVRNELAEIRRSYADTPSYLRLTQPMLRSRYQRLRYELKLLTGEDAPPIYDSI